MEINKTTTKNSAFLHFIFFCKSSRNFIQFHIKLAFQFSLQTFTLCFDLLTGDRYVQMQIQKVMFSQSLARYTTDYIINCLLIAFRQIEETPLPLPIILSIDLRHSVTLNIVISSDYTRMNTEGISEQKETLRNNSTGNNCQLLLD